MRPVTYNCQDVNLSNPNTGRFWDEKIRNSKKIIYNSPIFIHKNKLILSRLDKISGKILDVGFGYGYIEYLIEKHNLNLSIYGIDISNYAINFAKKNYKGVFKKANIFKIPYNVNFFDGVMAIDILEHLPKNKIYIALSQIKKVLKNKGLLIVSVPINETKKDRITNGHLRIYNHDIIKKELEKLHFEVKEEIYLFAFRNNYFLKNLINKLLKIRKPNLIIIVATKK